MGERWVFRKRVLIVVLILRIVLEEEDDTVFIRKARPPRPLHHGEYKVKRNSEGPAMTIELSTRQTVSYR